MRNQKRLENVFRKIRREHNKRPITAVFIQEHNLRERDLYRARAAANDQRLLLIVAPVTGQHEKGGAAIVIPSESITVPPRSSYHAIARRIHNTTQQLQGGRACAVDMDIGGHSYRLVSAYAHPDSEAHARPAFFRDKLAPLITPRTIMGIDANCVPDTTLDLKRQSNAPYNNTGANELNDLVNSHKLMDVARECLGNEPYFTSHHTVAGGTVTSTRIDRIYAPDLNGVIWEHVPISHDFFGRRQDALELDHEMVQIRIQHVDDEPRGSDLKTIDEAIFDELSFTNKVASLISDIIELEDPATNHNWRQIWNKIKREVKGMAIVETNRRKRVVTQETKTRQLKQDALKAMIDSGQATASHISQYIENDNKLREAHNNSYSLHQRVEEIAYNLGKAHDTGSASFYRPWKPKGAAQWITETIVADWTDTQNPIITGTQKGAAKQAATATTYWSSLFKKKPTNQNAFNTCLTTLSSGNRVQPPTAARCDEPIHLDEITSVCNTLPLNKSPGPDRLPNKFYKTMSSIVAPILLEVYNESREQGSFGEGFSAGIISVLYKKKDRNDPRNYRPITLLNSDYKILMRILTRRMNEAVVQFVSSPQNGFVPDSFLP